MSLGLALCTVLYCNEWCCTHDCLDLSLGSILPLPLPLSAGPPVNPHHPPAPTQLAPFHQVPTETQRRDRHRHPEGGVTKTPARNTHHPNASEEGVECDGVVDLDRPRWSPPRSITMEAEHHNLAAPARTPESLRRRQRDRLSPRRGFANASRPVAGALEVEGAPGNQNMLAPAPRAKVAVNRSPDAARKKPLQDGLRKENSMNRRAQRDAEDAKHEISLDGGAAARGGRHFTVSNVGNNGKIYLR